MIDYIKAAIFGLVQSVTEFLPISSTGHLVVLHKFFNLPIKNELAFDITLHLATLLAIIWFFRREILELIKSWLKSFKGESSPNSKLSWLIILGTVPAALAGYLFEDMVSRTLRSPVVVAIMLIIVGAFFIIAEKISVKSDDLNKLNWKKALLIGLAQAVALIPGTSRSGITIIAGLGVGLKREVAARLSFLLSLPIIFGAVIKKIPQVSGTNLELTELSIILVAFIFSLFSATLTIKYFLRFLKNNSLIVFAVYRFILSLVIIELIFLNIGN